MNQLDPEWLAAFRSQVTPEVYEAFISTIGVIPGRPDTDVVELTQIPEEDDCCATVQGLRVAVQTLREAIRGVIDSGHPVPAFEGLVSALAATTDLDPERSEGR